MYAAINNAISLGVMRYPFFGVGTSGIGNVRGGSMSQGGNGDPSQGGTAVCMLTFISTLFSSEQSLCTAFDIDINP
jgi:hypothetical protein